jgi:hypothetical protein
MPGFLFENFSRMVLSLAGRKTLTIYEPPEHDLTQIRICPYPIIPGKLVERIENYCLLHDFLPGWLAEPLECRNY